MRAAMRPGTAATMFARASAPTTMTAIKVPGTVGAGTALISWAKRTHSDRPMMMPAGTPMTMPTATATLDCQATAAAAWRWVKPSVFNKARSRRRRRTEAMSVRPRRDDGAECQSDTEDRRSRPHRAVVDNLGRAEHWDHASRCARRLRVSH